MSVLIPKCLSDLKKVDNEFAKSGSGMWKQVWNNKSNVIPKKDKYLMAFCTAVGNRHLNQAARELTKAYGEGASIDEINEVMQMLIWNTGIPYFTSEFNESPAMEVYLKIKSDTGNNISRQETVMTIIENYFHKKDNTARLTREN